MPPDIQQEPQKINCVPHSNKPLAKTRTSSSIAKIIKRGDRKDPKARHPATTQKVINKALYTFHDISLRELCNNPSK